MVKATHRFVNLYKIGRANRLGAITRDTEWRTYTLRMFDLLARTQNAHYIKASLAEYLPIGYANPLRVQQHH